MTLKELLIERLKGDIEQHKKNTAKELEDLENAVKDLEALTDEDVETEVATQIDNVRYLSQFTSLKKKRDETIKKIENKEGEIKNKK